MRGTGVMESSPTGIPKPSFVTRPTPFPPRIRIPGTSDQATVTVSSALSVTSGSSPASFTTEQVASAEVNSQRFTGKVTSLPMGRRMMTEAWEAWVLSARAAATAAAVVQAPVVKPVLSLDLSAGGVATAGGSY